MGPRNIIRVALLTGLAGLLTGCARQEDLPPIVYMCPMLKDAAVLEDHPGKCPACGMELKPVRIVQAYSCLNNTAFIQADSRQMQNERFGSRSDNRVHVLGVPGLTR